MVCAAASYLVNLRDGLERRRQAAAQAESERRRLAEQEAELERRRLAAAQQRYERSCALLRRLEQRMTRMQQVYTDVAVDPPVVAVPAGATVEAFREATDRNVAAIERAGSVHEAALVAARARAMVPSTFTLQREELAPGAHPARPAGGTERSTATGPGEVARRREEVERMAALLPVTADDSEVRRAQGAAREAVAAPDEAAFRRAFLRLRMTVVSTADRHKTIDARRREVEELRARLDGLPGADADEARRRLDEVRLLDDLPADLVTDIEAAARRARGEQDRSYALGAVAGTLQKMGYGVADDFGEAAVEGGAVVALPAERGGDHALRVKAGRDDMHFDLVRYADAGDDRRRDREVEGAWTEDRPQLVAGAAEQGVDLVFGEPEEPHDMDRIARQGGQRREESSKRPRSTPRARARRRGQS